MAATKDRRGYERLWRKNNLAKTQKSNKAYYSRNKERLKAEHKKYDLNQYGLTEKQYTELLDKQHGLCAICHQPETVTSFGKVRQLSVDHDHITGVVRGLLCTKCNQALGLLNDSVDRLRAAALYLEGVLDGKT